jgi:hypothetical protein
MKNKNTLNIENEEEIKTIWASVKNEGYSNSNLIVKLTDTKGLGVFAKKEIKKGQIIEFCHSIVLDWKRKYIHDRGIIKYAYWDTCQCNECKKHGNTAMILLGNGSVYNSAQSNDAKNAKYNVYPSLNLAIFIAEKDIKKNEEILTWWGEGYYNSWCKSKNENIK